MFSHYGMFGHVTARKGTKGNERDGNGTKGPVMACYTELSWAGLGRGLGGGWEEGEGKLKMEN